MKKLFGFLSIFIIIFTIPLVLSGCGSKKPKEKKLVIWHWMNDRKDTLDNLASQYKSLTGLTVEFKLFSPPDIYSQKVIAAARSGNLPDIFGILGEKKTMSSFIKANHVLNLTSYMEENNKSWENSFYPQALEVNRFRKNNSYTVEEGIYGVPIDLTVMEFVYNKDIFTKAGLDPESPPETFEEFLSYAKSIKETLGINGFICGWGEGWLINSLAVEWAINLMGEDKFIQTIEGKVPYTDKQWVEVFSMFLKMQHSGILADNITSMINKESEDLFSRGKAAFSYNGSWAVNVYKQLAPELNYKFFPLPKISNNYPVKIWGGAGSSFMIYKSSKNKNDAVDFLKWITSNNQQNFLSKETNNLPSIKNCHEGLPEVLVDIVDVLDSLTHPNIWPLNENSRVLEAFNSGLQQIIMGLKTPAEVCAEIQKIKERVSTK
ncbi:MAG: extracellular solute-binding protein [Candidatus Omnitrophica bacterium]|nr:extracellular solute-binding protein [Candidatus Omnitrophota bacterium]MCK5492497.1 extracellular solute-binding protein [Candidatus Omnitrophota bacterium]